MSDDELLDRSRALVERVLAAQGDAAEPELVWLQHALAERIEHPPARWENEDFESRQT